MSARRAASALRKFVARTPGRREVMVAQRPDAVGAFVLFDALVTRLGHTSVVVCERVARRDSVVGSIDRHPGGGVTWTSRVGDLRRQEPELTDLTLRLPGDEEDHPAPPALVLAATQLPALLPATQGSRPPRSDVLGMARNCGWCSSHQRRDWEQRLLRGDSVRDVASSTPYSLAAAYRHLRNHAAPALVAQARTPSSGVGMGDVVSRLLELTDDAAQVRHEARGRGDGRLLLRAISTERDSLLALADRLGIDSEEAVEQLAEARALADALALVLPEHPRFGAALAAALRASYQGDLADAVERASGPRALIAVAPPTPSEAAQ